MSQLYHVRLTVDNPDTIKSLDALAAKYNLTTFAQVAIESYLATEEGKNLLKALGGNGEPQKRKRRSTASHPVASTKQGASSVRPADVSDEGGDTKSDEGGGGGVKEKLGPLLQEKQPEKTTHIVPTGHVLGRIMRKEN